MYIAQYGECGMPIEEHQTQTKFEKSLCRLGHNKGIFSTSKFRQMHESMKNTNQPLRES